VVAAVVVVGTVVTVATAGAAGPLIVGAVASVGLTGTAATVVTGVAVGAVAGAVGGAAAGAAGEATRQTVNSKALGLGNEEFSGTKIVDSALKEAKTGALIGGAVGGVAALATTAVGTAAVGAVGKLAQRVAPNLTKAGVSAARGLGNAVTAVAERTGVTALSKASEKLGVSAAKSLFQEGSAGAKAVATFADTGSVAKTFGAEPKQAPPGATSTAQEATATARAAPPSSVQETGFGGSRATWANDPRALVAFEPEGSGVNVSDVFRGAQPPRTGGQMLADSLRTAGIPKPATIRLSGIINEKTLNALAGGTPPGETLLGRTAQNAVRELGGTITGWSKGIERGKTWIQATIKYP
jgi:hypothetical protein